MCVDLSMTSVKKSTSGRSVATCESHTVNPYAYGRFTNALYGGVTQERKAKVAERAREDEKCLCDFAAVEGADGMKWRFLHPYIEYDKASLRELLSYAINRGSDNCDPETVPAHRVETESGLSASRDRLKSRTFSS